MKELEDFEWFPDILRRFQMEFIGGVVEIFQLYQPLIAPVQQVLQRHAPAVWVDLCAGNANPVLYLHQRSTASVPLLLTDKFPHFEKIPHQPQVMVKTESYDVLSASFEKNGFYTMFNAFHHFNPDQQLHLLKSLQASGTPFMIVEILQPNPLEFVKILLTTTVGQIILAPFIRPFSWLRLLMTWIVPINLLTTSIDGVISVLKSRKPSYYQQLCNNTQTAEYQLKVQVVHSFPLASLTVITGNPIHDSIS